MINNKVKKTKRILAFLLSAFLVLDSSGIHVQAAQLPGDIQEELQSGTWDGTDTMDGEDSVIFANAEDVIASGTYYGMDWAISREGELLISGVYNAGEEGVSWHEYGSSITSAKVTAADVKSTQDWFRNLTGLESVDLAGFDSGNVRNMNGMFYMCSALETIKWNNAKTYNVTDMGFMFYGCRKLKTLDVSLFHTAKVTNMRYMFGGCSALKELAVGGFDTAKVTDMTGMFYNCCNISRLNVSNFNTSNVTNMSYMFAECNLLKTLDVTGFDTGSVTNMSSMFQNCSMLDNLDVSGFDTGAVEHMSAMFYGCNSLKKLDVSGFDTAYVTNMTHMFSDCRELEKIEFGNFSTVRVTDVDYMFYKCYSLKSLDLSSFHLLRVKSAENMLERCGALEQLKTPTSLKVEVLLPFEMQDAKGERYTMLPQNKYTSIELEHVPYGIKMIEDQVYTGKAIKPEVVVVKDGEILTKGVDYTVSYKNNKNVASADAAKAPTVIVTGKGRYSGSFTSTFNIVARELSEENTVVKSMVTKVKSKVQKLRPVVTVDGRRLVYKQDYEVEYPDTSEGAYEVPGSYEVVIRGTGNYTGEYITSMVILAKDQIKASEMEVDKIPACTYQEHVLATPSPKVTYNGNVLELNKDYSLSYRDNDKPGKATLIITGLENTEGCYVYGTLEKKFTIKGTALSKAKISYEKKAVYTGNAIYPEVTLTHNNKTLTPGTDYTIEYENNINVGKARIILTGCGGYTGVVKRYFHIQPENGVGDMLDVSVGDAGIAEYSTKGARPEVIVKLGEDVLQPGVDYTVSYKNNTAVAKSGAAKAPYVVIKGIGNYKFTRKEKFTIVEKSLGDADITMTVADKFTGAKDLRSKPVLTDCNGNTLKRGTDYTIVGYKIGGVDYDEDDIPADATTAIVTVKGKGGYKGELSKMYRIAKKSITKTKVAAQNLEYNGGVVEYTPELIELGMLVITDRQTNAELEYGVDYEIIGYRKNTRCGKAVMTIKGLGDYGGTMDVEFRIVTTKIPL